MQSERLANAMALAESVRFSADRYRTVSGDGILESSYIRYQFDEQGLRVSADVTPRLYSVLEAVCQRLRIESTDVLAFVRASPEVQAECYAGDTKDCLVTLTSGLIKLMSEQELAFVLGHEIGHFLLRHGAKQEIADHSIEGMMRQRYCEISADRVGMLAASGKDAAFRALIKMSCGLEASYLRFDIGTYLEQIRSAAKLSEQSGVGATHPSLVMRCRALLWFEMSREYREVNGQNTGESLGLIDGRLAKELKRFIDGPAHRRVAGAKETLRIWLAVSAAIRDGTLDKEEQAVLSKELSRETRDSVVKFLSLYESRTELESVVRDKLKDAAEFYMAIAPNEYAKEAATMTEEIGRTFSQSDFQEFTESLLPG
tara:strand:+ start:2319 stop:3434 length:1116 start_codon:yes stop_codon:yes gene_type:complete